MAKKWKRLAEIARRSGIPLQVPDDLQPLDALKRLAEIYPKQQIVFDERGRLLVRGISLNPTRFAQQVLYSLESRDSLSEEAFARAIESVGKRQAFREQRWSMERVQKLSGLSYESALVIGNANSSIFYSSPEWRALRYAALEFYGNRCMACGRSPKQGACIHVDHVKPRSLYPELALDPTNLQVLCEDCNLGKSNTRSRDWRGNPKDEQSKAA